MESRERAEASHLEGNQHEGSERLRRNHGGQRSQEKLSTQRPLSCKNRPTGVRESDAVDGGRRRGSSPADGSWVNLRGSLSLKENEGRDRQRHRHSSRPPSSCVPCVRCDGAVAAASGAEWERSRGRPGQWFLQFPGPVAVRTLTACDGHTQSGHGKCPGRRPTQGEVLVGTP